jgi:hypothetical protein
MPAWEYLTVSADLTPDVFDKDGRRGVLAPEQLNAMLNQYGLQGWELVQWENTEAKGSSIQALFIFKRIVASSGKPKNPIGFDTDNDGVPGSKDQYEGKPI